MQGTFLAPRSQLCIHFSFSLIFIQQLFPSLLYILACLANRPLLPIVMPSIDMVVAQ